MAKRYTKLERLPGGLRNASYRLGDTVLRIYKRDPSICQREVDLLRRIGDFVPVPQVIYAEPNGWKGVPPFALLRYVEGITYRELARSGDREAIAQAAFSVGATLAAITKVRISEPGPRTEIAWSKLEGRVPADLIDRLQAFDESWSPRLSELAADGCLVHGDFGMRIPAKWMDDSDAMWIKSERSDANI
jgi:aminoglycoside phosphotransferase (APT) family kinase protein